MARRKRRNPSTALKVVGALALAGAIGGTIYAFGRSPKEPVAKKTRRPSPAPDDGGGDRPSGGGQTANFVGSGWRWPHGDVFPNMGSFGQALEELGYDMGDWDAESWSPLDRDQKPEIGQFQRDFNLVDKYVNGGQNRLTPDDLIGAKTIDAILWALKLVQDTGNSWPLTVAEFRNAEEEPTS